MIFTPNLPRVVQDLIREVLGKEYKPVVINPNRMSHINHQNNKGETLLHFVAEQSGSRDVVDLFFSYGANITISNNENNTPLDIVAEKKGDYHKTLIMLFSYLGIFLSYEANFTVIYDHYYDLLIKNETEPLKKLPLFHWREAHRESHLLPQGLSVELLPQNLLMGNILQIMGKVRNKLTNSSECEAFTGNTVVMPAEICSQLISCLASELEQDGVSLEPYFSLIPELKTSICNKYKFKSSKNLAPLSLEAGENALTTEIKELSSDKHQLPESIFWGNYSKFPSLSLFYTYRFLNLSGTDSISGNSIPDNNDGPSGDTLLAEVD